MKSDLGVAIVVGNIWYATYFIRADSPTWFLLFVGLIWTALAFLVWWESRRKS